MNKDYDAVAIGERIASRRRELSLTQAQVAEGADMSPQFLACIERGIKRMRATNVARLSNVLDISSDYLLTGLTFPGEEDELSKSLIGLTGTELRALEEIIHNYLIGLGYEEESNIEE